jgi:methylmalonyl-CoA mutase
MIGLKTSFSASNLHDWQEQLKSELKGDDFLKLFKTDSLEEIEYSAFLHAESNSIPEQVPGKFPYTRGMETSFNKWQNGQLIHVDKEKENNKKALDLLMKGCDLLLFDCTSKPVIQWDELLEGIQFEYIQSEFTPLNVAQLLDIVHYFHGELPKTLRFNFDFLEKYDASAWKECIALVQSKQFPFCAVNGFKVQQAGATAAQEISFCMAVGNHYLNLLLDAGLTIDQAAACVHFSIGIGQNYFLEIAKIRALKQNWAAIIHAYQPEHSCSYTCTISAHIGWSNKSLLDPHTNLLRQTTEAMSALSGGVQHIIIHPYDSISKVGTSVLAERMALNIPLILQEESYFHAVIDPLGGSYTVEDLTQKIAKKSWDKFQEIEGNGGIQHGQNIEKMAREITQKAQQRIADLRSGSKTLIGINRYLNSSPENNSFLEQPKYLGMQQLIYEQELNQTI